MLDYLVDIGPEESSMSRWELSRMQLSRHTWYQLHLVRIAQ